MVEQRVEGTTSEFVILCGLLCFVGNVVLDWLYVHDVHDVTLSRFNGHLPGGSGLADTRMSPFWILLELRMMQMAMTNGAKDVQISSQIVAVYSVYFGPKSLASVQRRG